MEVGNPEEQETLIAMFLQFFIDNPNFQWIDELCPEQVEIWMKTAFLNWAKINEKELTSTGRDIILGELSSNLHRPEGLDGGDIE